MTFRPPIPRSLIFAGIALAPLAIAHAGDEDNLNERISASACQPRLSSDRAKLAWTGTDWAFASGETGEVVLECPIFTDWEDDSTGTRELEELRLWYRDSDGTGTDAQITAELRYIDPAWGVLSSVLEGDVDSNDSATTTLTQRAVSLGSNTMIEAQYFVVVTMTRNDSSETVLFRGVSFFEEP